MELTITVPESPSTPAADVVDAAARAIGWTPERSETAQEALQEHFAGQLYDRYQQHRVATLKREIQDNLPRPQRAANAGGPQD